MNTFIQKILIIISSGCILVGCNTENDIVQQTGSIPINVKRIPAYLSNTPIANIDDFVHFEDTISYYEYGVLDYRYARDKAFAELCANMQNYYPDEVLHELNLPSDLRDYTLLSFTDRPVIVYDYEEKPYYYEFPLLYRGDIIVGTVTVAAQPFNKELIHFLFPSPILYNNYSYHYKRYVGEYPCVYFSDDNATYYKAECNEHSEPILRRITDFSFRTNRFELFREKMERLSSMEFDDINHDLQNANYLDNDDVPFRDIDQYRDSFIVSASIREYWRRDLMEYDFSISDTFAISQTIQTWINNNIHEIDASYQGFLSEYQNDRLRLTHWEGYCGPAIMAWLYRGKYHDYRNLYLPIYNDAASNNSTYSYLYDDGDYLYYYMKPFSNENGNYPDIVQSHSEHTDNGLFWQVFRYTDQLCGEYPLLDWGLRACLPDITDDAYYIKFITAPISWLKNEQQPVVVEGIHGAPHYVGAIGYSYNQWWFIKYYMRLFVTDNGYFTDNHHHYPFWSILGGLNYAWVEDN